MDSRVETFSTPEPVRLKVRNPAGDVRVEAIDVDETRVELVALNNAEATKQAIERAAVGMRGDEIHVEFEGRGWSISIGNWGIGSPKIGVRVSCPTGSSIDCDTASADVRLSGTIGEARVRSASGDISAEHVEARLELKTASGDVRLDRVDGPCAISTVSGDVDAKTLGQDVAVNSVSGDVQLGEVAGDLVISSVSGDQRVRAAGPGEVALKAVSGDVHVAIRRGLQIKLDVNSVSGSIGSELEVSDSPVGSDAPLTDLRVRTVSGDVKITRAAGVFAA